MVTDIKPIKRLGQNFLNDQNIINKIVESLNVNKDDNLVEIGPGTGALTKSLPALRSYLGIEIDTRAFAYLNEIEFGENYQFLNQDFLKVNFSEVLSDEILSKYQIFGNLPYYITSSILFRIFELNNKPKKAVFMVQKEVAQRIVAKPGTKDNGILSILTEFSGSVKKLFDVSPNCFYPKPNVWSSIIEISFTNKYQINFKEFAFFIKTAFNQRRKKLSNSLKKYGIVPEKYSDKRAEHLSCDDFIELFQLLR